MKILLVYPQVSETFWSFKHALRVVRRKAAFPPLGALTVAAMLPESWQKKLVDINVRALEDQDILWADYVFISAMIAQKDSARRVADRCRALGVRVVGGGPLFRAYPDDFADLDHLVFGEAESIISELVRDLESGRPKKFYRASGFPSLDGLPVPMWDLINLNDYASMSIQYSRGCPFNCEFCDVIVMNGRVPRLKPNEQVLAELEALYSRGWRGSVFIVDDNFIGNKAKGEKPAQKHHILAERPAAPLEFLYGGFRKSGGRPGTDGPDGAGGVQQGVSGPGDARRRGSERMRQGAEPQAQPLRIGRDDTSTTGWLSWEGS